MSTAPDASDLLQHTESGVRTLTLNRLAHKNALTAAMTAQLADALEAAAADASVRVLVLQGDATVFCAGHDMQALLQPSLADVRAAQDWLANAQRMWQALAAFPKPLIAAVAGPAVGAGAVLLLHCDLVYAGDNAALSLPFVNLGLCPEGAASLLLAQRVGMQRAAHILLTGQPFMAEDALEMGLVARITTPGEVNALAHQQALRLAQKPLPALLATRQLLKSGQAEAIQARLAQESAQLERLLHNPAAREGMQAFIERRAPSW